MKTANCGFLSLIKGRFLIFISSAERLVLRSSLFCFFPCSCVSSILLFFLKNGTDYLSLFCVNFVFLPQATSLHGRPPNRYGDWTKCVSGCVLGISTGCRDCVTSEVFGFYFIVKRDILPWAAYYFDHFRRYIAPAGGEKKPLFRLIFRLPVAGRTICSPLHYTAHSGVVIVTTFKFEIWLLI